MGSVKDLVKIQREILTYSQLLEKIFTVLSATFLALAMLLGHIGPHGCEISSLVRKRKANLSMGWLGLYFDLYQRI